MEGGYHHRPTPAHPHTPCHHHHKWVREALFIWMVCPFIATKPYVSKLLYWSTELGSSRCVFNQQTSIDSHGYMPVARLNRSSLSICTRTLNPLLPSAHKSARIGKILILKLEGIIKKISYERRNYELSKRAYLRLCLEKLKKKKNSGTKAWPNTFGHASAKYKKGSLLYLEGVMWIIREFFYAF